MRRKKNQYAVTNLLVRANFESVSQHIYTCIKISDGHKLNPLNDTFKI